MFSSGMDDLVLDPDPLIFLFSRSKDKIQFMEIKMKCRMMITCSNASVYNKE